MMQVPEVSNTTAPTLDADFLLSKLQMAQQTVGVESAVPMVIGLITMARLAKLTNIDVPTFVQKLIPLYQELLKKLSATKVSYLPLMHSIQPARNIPPRESQSDT